MALGSPKSVFYLADIALVYSILFAKFNLCLVALADRLNLLICKTTIPMLKAIMVSSADRCISVIVGNRPNSQMLWINASRIVATMQDMLAFWDCPHKLFIYPSVSANTNSYWFHGESNYAVAEVISIPSPNPASACLFHPAFNGHLRNYALELVECASLIVFHVAEFAKIPTKRWPATQQARLLNLFHAQSSLGGLSITIP